MNLAPDLKPLDILLYRGKGFTSWLIQSLTKSRYNHIAVVVDPIISIAIESNTGHQSGVKAVDLRKLNFTDIDVFRLQSQYSSDKSVVIAELVSRLGASYDYFGVIFLGLLKIISLFTANLLPVHNWFQMKKDYYCSELCWAAFAADGLDLAPQIGSMDIVSPGDIALSPMLFQLNK